MSDWLATSDDHFGHRNIIDYCERPFSCKEKLCKDVGKNNFKCPFNSECLTKMDTTLTRNWNGRVRPQDYVIVIGDFAFHNGSGGKPGEGTIVKPKTYIEQLNGNKIFIKGNHDGNNLMKSKITSMVVKYGDIEFWCTHRPANFNSNYRYNLVGHVHKAWKYKKTFVRSITGEDRVITLINVGVDVWNFMPVSFEEILRYIHKEKL